ncbi:hypothetical protein P350_30980 [Burkholderia cepacia JBK9]|nr:hypothetical protein P350_30980 [Burkholderia cepacia JBK9]
MHVVADDRTSCVRTQPCIAHAAFAATRKFRSCPHFVRCHTGVMEIALHSHSRRSSIQTFKTNE